MKILVVGPYRQPDGWGNACKDYIRALMTQPDVELTCRPVFFTNSTEPLDKEIEVLEKNRYDKYDAVIQNLLPSHLEVNRNFGKNIALIHTESAGWHRTTWPQNLNMMDSIIVPSKASEEDCIFSGVKHEATVIGIPTDISKYNAGYEKLNLPELQDNFVFYFIGEYIERKNVQMLVAAFHLEFKPTENVSLVLKLGGGQPVALANKVSQDILELKKILRVYSNIEQYKKELVITARLTDNDINALHQMCDCFVMPSAGESWSKPTFDALGFGKTPIVTKGIGASEFIDEKNGYLIDSIENHCMVTDAPLPYLYTSRETWNEPSLFSLRQMMRKAYECSNKNREEMIDNGSRTVEHYSYENIGQELVEEINAIL